MTKKDLFTALARPLGKAAITKIARIGFSSAHFFDDILELTFEEDKKIAFRAAWLLEYLVLSSAHTADFVKDFVKKYPFQTNPACRRHYTRIMIHLEQRQETLAGLDLKEVVESTFEWLIEPDSPVAVKANCLEVLLGLSLQYSWIGEELKMQTEFLMENGTAALQARGKKILKKLRIMRD